MTTQSALLSDAKARGLGNRNVEANDAFKKGKHGLIPGLRRLPQVRGRMEVR